MTNRLWIWFLLPLWSLAQVAPASGGPAFEEGLKKAAQLRIRGQWKTAREAAIKLIADHDGQDYVRVKAAELEELVRECAFAEAHPAVQAKDVISGEIVAWTPSTGHIKLRYTPDNLRDWESGNGLRVLPLVFSGAHSVEIKAKVYRTASDQAAPLLLVCAEPGASIQIVPGVAPEKVQEGAAYTRAALQLRKTDSTTMLDEKEFSPVRPGKPLHIKVKVASTLVSVSHAGAVYLEGKKARDQWGRVAMSNLVFDEIILEGQAESAWIQQRVDEATAKQRDKFQKTYQRSLHLPDWIFAGFDTAKSHQTTTADIYPTKVTESHWKHIEPVQKLFNEERHRAALPMIQKWTDKQVPPLLKSYFLAVALLGCERLLDALTELRLCRVAYPKWAVGAQIEGHLLRRLEQSAEAIKVFESLASLPTLPPPSTFEAALDLLYLVPVNQ